MSGPASLGVTKNFGHLRLQFRVGFLEQLRRERRVIDITVTQADAVSPEGVDTLELSCFRVAQHTEHGLPGLLFHQSQLSPNPHALIRMT